MALTIKELEQCVAQAEATLRNYKEQLNAAMMAEFKYRVGDVIRSSTGVEALINCVFVKWGSVRFTAVLRKKDGEWGKRPAPLYDRAWQHPAIIRRETAKEGAR